MRGQKSLLHGSGTSVSLIFFWSNYIVLQHLKANWLSPGFWAEGNLPNYSAPNNEFRRLFGQIPMLFWYVFFSQRFWFIGKIGNSGLVNHPPIVFLHMNIVELERATSVSQAPPPQHYPWHPPRSKNAAQQFQDEVLSAVSSAQSEIHQKLQDKARAHVRKGTRKTHVVKWLLRSNQMVRKFYAYLIVSQMVQEQVYVMLRKLQIFYTFCCLRLSRSTMRFWFVLGLEDGAGSNSGGSKGSRASGSRPGSILFPFATLQVVQNLPLKHPRQKARNVLKHLALLYLWKKKTFFFFAL